ncbi:Puromycin resistance protein pur8 [Nocardia seriolae]|uniref:Puromycin resistance protein pur8 n=1 Tax=Nocardia seriolae TaxID=37332 RepID=A0ABC8AY22_9NOCA|nr:MFS transporter [Nocardia seriolae]APA99315.1 Puromycin resistance protein pur8 [Nocardia seriolae]
MTSPLEPRRTASPTAIVLTMAGTVFLLAMAQTLPVPALPQIGLQLGVSATTVGWVTTATMLAASALTPLLGRLGDVYGHKPVIVATLVVTLIGSLLAASADSIEWLIVGRALQGASFGLFPLAISVLRHELPAERLTGALAVTASTLGVGSGVALVATGLLTQGGADYRRIFWLCVVLTVLVLALAVVVLPRRAGQGGRVDYVGAAVLGLGLVCLLLPISQGHEWGWGSARTSGLFIAAVVVLAGFLVLQSKLRSPLVATSLLAHRPVAVTNMASFCVGFAMFSVFRGATYFVGTPRALAGFGFDASVLRTSVAFMLPGAVASVLMGPIAGLLVGRIGARYVLLLASVIGLGSLTSLALLHTSSAEVIVALIIGNAAIAIAYAAMPALLVANVAPHETGIANSINSIMRTVGGAIGSALVVTILTSDTLAHKLPNGAIVSLPAEGAYRIAFLTGAAFFALAALLAAFGLRHNARPLTPYELEEEAALGAAGEFATVSTSL